jgi:serine/threonine-protein kinase
VRSRARREAIPGSRYELALRLGEGGTATVWLGRRAAAEGGLGRLVAIKRAHPHLARDADARRLLLREAAVASRIHHANVVPVLDVDAPEGELLLVLEYVEGASLADLLDAPTAGSPALSPEVAIAVVLDLAAGLTAVHELAGDDGRPLGLLHRDVSPQNVLVGVDGTARVTDFGLAKLGADLSRASGTFAGKLAYLAPEHVDGAPYDARGEVFATGVVAWEAIAGARLFGGEGDVVTRASLRDREPPSLATLAPGVGPRVDAVVRRALEKHPARRFPSVRAFAAALDVAAREAGLVGSRAEVAEAVRRVAGPALERRRAALASGGGPGDDVVHARAEHTRELVRAPRTPDAPTPEPPAIAPPAATSTTAPRAITPSPARPPRRAAFALAGTSAAAIVLVALASPRAPTPAPALDASTTPFADIAPPEPSAPASAPQAVALDDLDPAAPVATSASSPPRSAAPPPPRAPRAPRAPTDTSRARRPPANPYR